MACIQLASEVSGSKGNDHWLGKEVFSDTTSMNMGVRYFNLEPGLKTADSALNPSILCSYASTMRSLAAQTSGGARENPRKSKSTQTGARRPRPQLIIGPRKLTRFEKARVVGARALQISMGAPVLIHIQDPSKSPIDIAIIELEQGVLPMSIRRTLPDGESQNIPLQVLTETSPETRGPNGRKEKRSK